MENPDASLERLARAITEQGAPISAQGVEQRFVRQAAELAKEVLKETVRRAVQAAGPVPIELLKRFNGVYLIDCSKVALPNALAEIWPGTGKDGEAGQAQLKQETMLELGQGGLAGLNLLPGRTHDSRGLLANKALEQGSLRIQDLGYWNLARMSEQDSRDEYWLSRHKQGTYVQTLNGEKFDVPGWLRSLEKQGIEQAEHPVILGLQGLLEARLIAQRMPQEVAARRRAALKKRKQKEGKQPTKAELVLFGWTLLDTNAPPELLCADEALILYAVRWQIELLFKLWKSHLKLGQSRSKKPWRRLCEIYCKLIGAIVQHWLIIAGAWDNPRRSWVKAAQVVKEYAKMISMALAGHGSLEKTLRLTTEAMRVGCNQNSRRKQPNTWLTLLLYILPWGLN